MSCDHSPPLSLSSPESAAYHCRQVTGSYWAVTSLAGTSLRLARNPFIGQNVLSGPSFLSVVPLFA